MCLVAACSYAWHAESAAVCRLSKMAEEELTSLQASNFSSTGNISAHASGVRTLVLRVLKAAISLTKAKPDKQKDQVSASSQRCVYLPM